jgi:hypothetical protein
MNQYLNQETQPGTIGRAVQDLIRRYGHYPTGFTILEKALRHCCYPDDCRQASIASVKVDGRLIHDTPGYQEAEIAEDKAMESCRELIARCDAKLKAAR